MRPLIFCFAIFLMIVTVASAIGLSYGTEAPDFRLASEEGTTVSLDNFKDSILVLIFWRTEQKRSVLALKDANDLFKDYEKKGVEVISIIEGNVDVSEARKVIEENKIGFPLFIDQERDVYGSYGVRVHPTTVLIDRDRKIAYDIPTRPLTYKTKLRAYIRKMLGEIDEDQLKALLSPHNVKKDPEQLESERLYNLAMKFTDQRMYDMAMTNAAKAIEVDPKQPDAYVLLGFLYLDAGDADKSIKTFNDALKIAPGAKDAMTGLGGAYVLKGEAEKAIEVLEPATHANPYSQMTYIELGKAYELKGDHEKAIAMYKKAINRIIKKKILPASLARCK